MYRRLAWTGAVLLLLSYALLHASARHTADTSFAPSALRLRQLQEDPKPANCTPPRTSQDTKLPFCFQPDTISPQARQVLSTAAAGASPVTFKAKDDLAAQVQRASNFYKSFAAPMHDIAVKRYLQTVRNDSIGGVDVVVAVPKGVNETVAANTKVLLYLHGGGYIVGSCHWLLSTVAATAAGAGLTIICPEYRLAPEHPFPAGLNDALTVCKSLINQKGYKAKNIVLLGDSAGGGMVAAVAVQLQREKVHLPAALGMLSPWADVSNRGDTKVTLNAVDPVVAGIDPSEGQQDELSGLTAAYVGGTATLLSDPLVSPVLADYAALFAGGALPPTLIQVGLRETLLSDAVRLYHKMKAAAPAPGHVVISPYEGMWHVFQAFIDVPEAAVASKEMADYFTRALKGQICK